MSETYCRTIFKNYTHNRWHDCLRSLLRRVNIYYTASVWNTSKLVFILKSAHKAVFDEELTIWAWAGQCLAGWVRQTTSAKGILGWVLVMICLMKSKIEQNLNIRSCTSSWVSITAIYRDNSYLAHKRLSYVRVGFRFAPKLHGILTKAQAVLQLFSFASIGLAYQIGLYVTQAALLLAHKALYMVLEITHHFQVQGLNMLVLVHARYLYFYGLDIVSHLKLLANKAFVSDYLG